MISDYLQHRRTCAFKQAERAQRIEALKASGPFTAEELDTIDASIQQLVTEVHNGVRKPIDILRTYAKVAVKAQEKTNCITEVMVKSAEKWVEDGSINMKGPLAGIPISLKDSIVVEGYDSTVGYSGYVGNKVPEDGTIVRLLKDAGAVPYVKTNVPITLLSFESTNDLWGRTSNPHNNKYSPGGSTGGEGALLALGGRIGIGSDVAGSVRAPAHFSGIYSLRCSTGRWPKVGTRSSMAGQEGVPAVYSPMTRTMNDLSYFTKALIGMEMWKYDYSIHPIPWRQEAADEVTAAKKLRIGIMRTDKVVDPSPACERALTMVEEALKRDGHEIVEIDPPSALVGLRVASQLLLADGGEMYRSHFRTGEWEDPAAAQMSFLMKMPRFAKFFYHLWVKYVRRDAVWAELIRDWSPKTAYENFKLVAEREAYRNEWFEWWKGAEIDFMITPPNATPAVPHDGMKDAVSSCGYTFLFNLLDYTCGILPVTHVDKELDKLPADFNIKKLNGVAQGAYKLYDSAAMHGLPVGVQVVGKRLEEEKVMALMERIEVALGGEKYSLLDLD
ncbi:hypothetical protein TD95_004314 [Thielaviopsis punctulata]|uniref:amidase n=1 Tax=Thielaviopsis punctulata TaxID=72032 RepID=A0A0F4ZG62_9PEZI|nr:hypothetical protein TD95_004314 [Thielaviopsis punctulata]